MDIYKELNNEATNYYNHSIQQIKELYRETQNNLEYFDLLNSIAKLIIATSDLSKTIQSESYSNIDILQQQNEKLFEDIFCENYKQSFANPKYCTTKFGKDIGQLLCYFYTKFRNYVDFSFVNKIYMMSEYNGIFIKVFEYVKKNKINYDELKEIMISLEKENKQRNYEIAFKERFNSEFLIYNNIIQNSDFYDISYLYKFGIPVTENDIKYSKYILNLPEEKIERISSVVVNGFLNSFKSDNKDRKDRNVVRVIYNLGEERIIRQLIHDFDSNGIKVSVQKPVSTQINKQYEYDHRFDNALFVEEEYIETCKNLYENAAKTCNGILNKFCGSIYFERFGEAPFNPEEKDECLKLTLEQTKLMQSYNSRVSTVIEEYIPDNQRSFCIIAFPTPEIGPEFEEIFDHIYSINTLDNQMYEKIQQKIINALDCGKYVWVKGKGNNQTNIKIRLHDLEKKDSETNFQNCLADVNIPVGEVFTSPLLVDTTGILHVSSVYLNDLEFKDLYIEFENGYTKEYNCKNFDDEEKNKNYIKENLLYPHETLPIGEFAIGTNTLAYAIANKYDIVNILPILIVEKMGPHFAIGDTCFSYSEDNPVYNSDGKKIIAVDNEKTIQRKNNLEEAYTNVHTDITIPYHDIEFITVVLDDDSTIDIIRNGRFVLEGTMDLNHAFDIFK